MRILIVFVVVVPIWVVIVSIAAVVVTAKVVAGRARAVLLLLPLLEVTNILEKTTACIFLAAWLALMTCD